MNIRLRAELEKLIEEDTSGADHTRASRNLWSALFLFYRSRKCGSRNRTEIGTKIEEGYAAAQRGRLLDSDSLRQLMDDSELSS